MKKQLKLSIFFMALGFLFSCILPVKNVRADGIVSLPFTLKYGQTEARAMIDMINDFRTGGDAWIWNSNDTEKVALHNLEKLQYDYELEEIAMQRALEIAVMYSHTRPDGTDYTSLLSHRSGEKAENIAAGYKTSADVFEAWEQSTKDYTGQKQRRNMLGSNFRSTGFGHVIFDGVHYWVQVFSGDVSSSEMTLANNSTSKKELKILGTNIKSFEMNASKTSLNLTYGDTVDLPKVVLGVNVENSWPEKVRPTSATIEWAASKKNMISVSKGKITPIKTGSVKLLASAYDDNVEILINIGKKNINGAKFNFEDVDNDGVPDLESVSVAGLSLTENIDYTSGMTINEKEKKISVKIKGCGNYTGKLTKTISYDITSQKKGSVLTDASGKYLVTKAAVSGEAELQYLSPLDNVTSVSIPATVTINGVKYNVTSIAESAFDGNTQIKSVSIGKKVLSIGKKAFFGCKNLKKINIKTSGLLSKNVGAKAFKGISTSASITVPKDKLDLYKKIIAAKGASQTIKVTK